MRDENLIRAVFDAPWAILESKLAAIAHLVRCHAEGTDSGMIKSAIAERGAREHERQGAQPGGSIGVIPIHGTIVSRGSAMTEMSGLTSTESISSQFSAMVQDPQVNAIILDIDSPGGSVYGVQELSDQILAARGTKPIVAQVWDMAASAAYWIAAAADEIVVTPSGEVGSIGVIAVHSDLSEAYEKEGIKNTIIQAGRFKGEGSQLEPLTAEALAFEQSRVDDYYKAFVSAVAKGRGVSASAVRSGFGEGRMVGAEQAVSDGMADKIGTFHETVIRLGTPRGRNRVGAMATKTAQARRRRVEVSLSVLRG